MDEPVTIEDRTRLESGDAHLSASRLENLVRTLFAAEQSDKARIAGELANAVDGKIDRLVSAMDVHDSNKAADLSLVLDLIGDDHIPQLVAALGSTNQFVQGSVIASLARRRAKAVDLVIGMLDGEDQVTTGAAIAVIRKIGAGAVPGLEKAIDPSAAKYSPTAVTLLAELDPRALSKFSKLLADGLASDDQFKSSAAIRAYAAIGPAAATELVGFLAGPNPFLQQNAANVLVSFGMSGAAAVIDGLGNSNQYVQQNCYAVLKRIGRPAVPLLLRAAETDAAILKQNARRLLEEVRATPKEGRRWWSIGG